MNSTSAVEVRTQAVSAPLSEAVVTESIPPEPLEFFWRGIMQATQSWVATTIAAAGSGDLQRRLTRRRRRFQGPGAGAGTGAVPLGVTCSSMAMTAARPEAAPPPPPPAAAPGAAG